MTDPHEKETYDDPWKDPLFLIIAWGCLTAFLGALIWTGLGLVLWLVK